MTTRRSAAPAIAFIVAAFLGAGLAVAQDGEGRSRFVRLLEAMLSTADRQVSLVGLQGVFTSNPSVERITVADRAGIWLEIEGVEVIWTRSALLDRSLEIQNLEAQRARVLRRPLPGDGERADAGSALPVEVTIDDLTVLDLMLDEPVLGAEARLAAEGSAQLSEEVVAGRLAIERQDRSGSFAADFRFQPADNVLAADLRLNEPAGGLVADWLELRGRPAVTLSVDGTGPLDQWRADVDLQADGARVLGGGLAVSRAEAGYRVTGELSGALQPVAPEQYAALVAGESSLAFDLLRRDDGSISVEASTLRSAGVDLTASGSLTSDMVPASGDVRVTLGQAGRTELPFVPGDVSVRRLEATLGLDPGDDAPWRADITAEGLESEFGRAGGLALVASGQAADLTVPGERTTTFRVEASAAGIAVADPAMAAALGPSMRLTATGSWSSGEPVTFDDLQAVLTGATASFAGTATAANVAGRFGASVTDLSRFAPIAGRPLGGGVQIQANGAIEPSAGDFKLQLDGAGTDLRLAHVTLDRLLAGTTRIAGGVARRDGELRVEGMSLASAHATVTASGAFAAPDVDLTVAASLADLSSFSERAAGTAEITARVTGTTGAPRVEAEAHGEDIVLMGRPLSGASARFSGVVAGAETAGEAELTGELGDVPVSGSARLTAGENGARQLDALLLSVGESRASGALTLRSDGLLTGNLAVVSPDISKVAPLFLVEASGMVKGDIALTAEGGRQSARFSGVIADLVTEGVTLASADLSGVAADLFNAPQVDGAFSLRGLQVGGLMIVSAQGRAERQGGTTRFSAETQLPDGRASLAGNLQPSGQGLALALDEFTYTRPGVAVSLAAPTTLRIAEGTAEFDAAVLNAGAGQVTIDGRAGSSLHLGLRLQGVPASLVNAVAPDLGAEGTVSGTAALSGTPAAPQGRFDATWQGASLQASRNAGLGPLTVAAEGSLADSLVRLNGRASGADGINVQIAGTISAAASAPIDLRVAGAVPLSLGNRSLSDRGAALQGALSVDVTVTGTTTAPQFAGRVTSEGGGFIDPETGITLSDLSLSAAISNNRLVVERLTARSGDGTVSASGSVGLEAGAGLPVDLRAVVRQARYVDGTLVAARFDADLTLTGSMAAGPVLGGTVFVDRAEITVPEQLPGGSIAVDVEHVAVPADVRETLTLARNRGRGAGPSDGGEPRGIALAVTIDAPQQIFVRGRGLDAELGGELRLSGRVSAVVADGAFEMRRGRLDVFTQRINFDRGLVTFAGDLDPVLDFAGSTDAEDVVVTVSVSGRASDPEVHFSSTPELPEDEVLARLIFNRSIAELSPVQIARLATAAAQLSGASSGGGLFNQLRETTGLDELDIVTDAEGGPALAAGRYVSENVYIGVQQGVTEGSSRVTIDLDITEDVKARGAVSPQGESSLGVFYEREY